MKAAAAALLVLVAALTLTVGSARAGQWVQVSCENPDGSSSNADGWVGSASGTALGSSTTSTSCAAGAPLTAELMGAQGPGNTETLAFNPPPGSTLVNGTVTATLDAEGSSGLAELMSPTTRNPPFLSCANGSCSPDPETVTMPFVPSDYGQVIEQAVCDTTDAGGCTPAADGVVASVALVSSQILMSNQAQPGASGQFTGTALGTVAGTGQLLFTATDGDGPGVYLVTMAIDGTPVSSATPNPNGGSCVSVGTDATTGALMFDGSQPCPLTTTVDAAVPTAGIANGAHTLTATVTDAAGNSAVVFSQQITVDNPVATPTPPTTPTPTTPKRTASPKILDKLIAAWDSRPARTRLNAMRFARRAKLPAHGTVSVTCAPARRCPKLKPAREKAAHAARLFSALVGRRFRSGDVLQLTISAPHRRAERFVFRFHLHRAPTAHVAYGIPKRKTETSAGARA